MRYLKALGTGLLLLFAAFLGARATMARQRAQLVAGDKKREELLSDVVMANTAAAKQKASIALDQLDKAERAEAALKRTLERGASHDETLDNAFHRYQSAARSVRDDNDTTT